MRRLCALLSAVLVMIPLVPGTAQADDSVAYERVAYAKPTTMVESPDDPVGSVRATLALGTVAAGTSLNLSSELVVGDGRADGAPSRVAVGHKITCQEVGGTTLADGQIWSGQNLLANQQNQKLVVRMLFTPATTGNYECLLRAYLNSGLVPGRETARLVSGFVAVIDSPAGPVAQSFGPSSNTHIALDVPGLQLHPVDYQPLPGATSFLAITDVYVTSCYSGGGDACGAGSYPASGTARVRFRTVATPSSTAPGCTVQASPFTTTAVTHSVHHRRILGQLTVTQPAAGCGTWRITAFAEDADGTLPFVIHGIHHGVTYARPPSSAPSSTPGEVAEEPPAIRRRGPDD
ncbi:hypothetical protein OG474_17160 [Kribbella sp. NBC_01505]|uniref:hypothetical protein n=1 Tax=Kribbella sp. NBC_01505 TaxID=2903580 RepID=UPI00386C1408